VAANYGDRFVFRFCKDVKLARLELQGWIAASVRGSYFEEMSVTFNAVGPADRFEKVKLTAMPSVSFVPRLKLSRRTM
jgi:hypothetical protein